MSEGETEAHRSALLDAGFVASGYLIYEHPDLDWGNIVVSRSHHAENQTYTVSISVDYIGTNPNGDPQEGFSFAQLPANLKMTVETGYSGTVDGRATLIKLGEDYLILLHDPSEADTSLWEEAYYLEKTAAGWRAYGRSASGTWNTGEAITSLESYGPLNDFEHIFNNDVSDYTRGADVQHAGQSCSSYVKEGQLSYGGQLIYSSVDTVYLNAAGFVMKYNSDITYSGQDTPMNVSLIQVVAWDTGVTTFGSIDLPQ